MRNGAVVALEEVLARDLPVRVELELRAEAELQRIDVEDLGELRRHVAERLRERSRVGIGIHEDERAPRVGLDLPEPELVRIEPRLAIRAWRCAQPPVERVRPSVVRALQRLARTGPAGHDVPAVTTDVEERSQFSVARACNHYGDLAGGGREKAGLSDLAGVARVLPRARKDPLTLAPQDVGIRVPSPRQRLLHAREL